MGKFDKIIHVTFTKTNNKYTSPPRSNIYHSKQHNLSNMSHNIVHQFHPPHIKEKDMFKSNHHNIASTKTKTKNDFLNISDFLNILPTHDLLHIKKHLLQHVSHVGNLLQYIDNNIDSNKGTQNGLDIDLKSFIKMYAATDDGIVFSTSYMYVGLFMDLLNRNDLLETLEVYLERRFSTTKKYLTSESSAEEVRVFLFFLFFLLLHFH